MKIQHNFTKSEHGRSMVEMLGVLAIIGVLSIGGIQAYTYSMNKYRINNALNEFRIMSNQLAITLLTSQKNVKELDLNNPYNLGKMDSLEYAFSYGCGNYLAETKNCHMEETGFWFSLKGVPGYICKNMLQETKYLPFIVEQKLNNEVVLDGSLCVEENNELTFLFNADDSGILAKDLSQNNNQEEPKEEIVQITCPDNTSESGEGGLAKTFTDTSTGKMVLCYCNEIYTAYNASMGICETQPTNCINNSQCNRGEYCVLSHPGSQSVCSKDTSGTTGTCRNAANDIKPPKANTNPPFIVSNSSLIWWNAFNFCQALGKKLVSVSDYKCVHSICNSGCVTQEGYCHASADQTVDDPAKNDMTSVMTDMVNAYGYIPTWTDEETGNSSCNGYTVYYSMSAAFLLDRTYNNYAVCK